MTIQGCLLAILLAGCAGPMATASGPSSPGAPPSGPHAGSTDASAMASALPSVSVPPMPAEFPVHASMTPRDAPAGLTASWRSDALPPEIYGYYREELPRAGFDLDLEAPGGEAAILRFHAADGTAYQLTFTGSGPVEVELGAPRP
jgi:hypothetical protein